MMKPEYHITPEYGFLNDPNGLAQFNGKYHVFYQWLPEVTPQGNKRWRHCESDDLIQWKDKGCGLQPESGLRKTAVIQVQVSLTMDNIICFIQVMSETKPGAGKPISVQRSQRMETISQK